MKRERERRERDGSELLTFRERISFMRAPTVARQLPRMTPVNHRLNSGKRCLLHFSLMLNFCKKKARTIWAKWVDLTSDRMCMMVEMVAKIPTKPSSMFRPMLLYLS